MQDTRLPSLSHETVSRYLDEAIGQFEQAAAATVSVQNFFQIAGHTIEIQIAGEALIHLLTPALMHRAMPQPQTLPELTIRAFDSASTGVPMARPIWPEDSYTTRNGLLTGVSSQHLLAAYDLNTGIFNLQDTLRGQGIYWIRNGHRHPQFEMSIPFRVQLYWWMRTRGYYLVHGGAVCKKGQGLLFVGKGGSGKSTSALACLEAGWNYIADDFVIFEHDPEPTVYNVYQSAKLTPEHFGNYFSQLSPAIHEYAAATGEKTMLMLDEHFWGHVVAQSRLVAIIFPTIAHVTAPRLKRTAAQSAFTALAASTLQQMPGATPQDVRAMMALVQKLPTYSLEIGGNPAEIPLVLEQLLQ